MYEKNLITPNLTTMRTASALIGSKLLKLFSYILKIMLMSILIAKYSSNASQCKESAFRSVIYILIGSFNQPFSAFPVVTSFLIALQKQITKYFNYFSLKASLNA